MACRHLLASAHRDVLLGRNPELLGWLVECIQKEPAAQRAGEFGSDRSCPTVAFVRSDQPGARCRRDRGEPATQRVDVAVRRWERYTGKAAVLDRTGQTVEAERAAANDSA